MQLLRLVILENVLLLGLILVLSGEVSHQLLISDVVEDLLLDQSLILVLYVLDDSIDLRGVWVLNSVVIKGLADKSDTKFVDFGSQLESALIRGEIVLDGWVLPAPGQHHRHCWVQVPQVLFDAELPCVIHIWVLGLQGLVVHLGLYDIGLARVLRLDLFEALSVEDIADFGGLLTPVLKLFVDSTRESI